MDDADDERRTLVFNTLAQLPQDVLLDIRLCVSNMTVGENRLAYLLDVLNELLGETATHFMFIPAGERVPGTDYRRTALDPRLLEGDTEGKLDTIWGHLVPQENRVVYNIAHGIPVGDPARLYAVNRFAKIQDWWRELNVDDKRLYLKRGGVIP